MPFAPDGKRRALRIRDPLMLPGFQHQGIAAKLLPHTERRDNQPAPAMAVQHKPNDFQLHDRLAQPEGREDRAPPAGAGPFHDETMMVFEDRIDILVGNCEARLLRQLHLGLEKGQIGVALDRLGGQGWLDGQVHHAASQTRLLPVTTRACSTHHDPADFPSPCRSRARTARRHH